MHTMHLSYTDTNIISKQTKTRFHTTHVTCEFHRVRPKLFMSLWYVQWKPCTYLPSWVALSSNGPNRAPPDPRQMGVPSSVSKTIDEPMVCLTQTENLSCTDANTISKQIETRFHMTHNTLETYWGPLILFPSLRYVQRKLCTDLASRVALSPNGPNWASTWASSPRSPIERVQNDYYAYGMSSAYRATILH
jgi:hypothetical protein